MEDRRAWIAARAAEISHELGYPSTPPIVFEAGAWGQPIQLETITRDGPRRLNIVGHPRLLISPEAPDNLGEAELRYRLTLELLNRAPGEKEDDMRLGMRMGLTMMVWPAVTLLSMLACASLRGWIWLLAMPAVLLVIPLGFPFYFRIVDADTIRRHLRAIELTGDATTGVAVLWRMREGHPRGILNILFRPSRRTRALVARLKREAEQLGYRTEATLDKDLAAEQAPQLKARTSSRTPK
ncbi:MAG: hypothetical protein ACHQ50_04670 [Fimbriimonadales bacterium]